MKNNYDPIANYYDVLSRIVYFRSQLRAQIAQLSFIPADSNILILGGGTGWILDEIARVHPTGLRITYVEISERMLNLSQKRNTEANAVAYVHCAAEDFESEVLYDVVMTAFFFDNFPAAKVAMLFKRIDQLLRKDGLWLFTDFYYTEKTGKLWQAMLLKAMYLFFRIISNVEARALINVESSFERAKYLSVQSACYYRGFIKSVVYRKT